MWEHANNHVMLTFRLYYQGDQLNPNFPAPVLMVNLQDIRKKARSDVQDVVPKTTSSKHASAAEEEEQAEDRRLTVQEVREHLELLKEFDGIIPAEEIAQRKRDLFLALPPVPAKRHKVDA